jgi:hypothetical protein
MNREKYLKGGAGFILMPLLVVMGLVSLAAGGALLSGQLDLRAAARLKTAIQAFYIAEAGLNHGWDELQNSDGVNDFRALSTAAGRTTLFRERDFDDGSYTVTAEAVAGSDPGRVKVTSTGCLPAGDPCPSGHSKAVMEAEFRRQSLFLCALCGKEGVTLSGGSQTDSFDSRKLPYTILTAGTEGDVLSNGNILLSGLATRVKGNAVAGESVLKIGATVTGASMSGAPLRPYLPVSPCGPPYSSGVGITGGLYDPTTGQLRGSGAVPIVLAPGSYCFSSIDLSGGVSTLAISGPVTISLTAHSLLTGGGVENPTLVAENLKIFSSVSSAKGGLDIAGGPLVYMAVYAPNARVVVSGSGDLYGSVVGATVSATTGAKFHYDKRLKDNQDGGIVMVTWRELF